MVSLILILAFGSVFAQGDQGRKKWVYIRLHLYDYEQPVLYHP